MDPTSQQLRSLAKAGVPMREQAETFGVTVAAIARLRKELGIRHTPAWRRVPVGMLGDGTATEIARRAGHSHRAVTEAARRAEVELPDGRGGAPNPERTARARAMRATGMTFATVGAALGVTRQRAWQMCRREAEK